MTISAIAIDDEPLALNIIEDFCGQLDFIQLQKTFTQTVEAKKHLGHFPVDLIFLDINMPEISGIDFYQNLSHHVMVIFTTAYAEFAVKGFELSAVDYLLKPFSFERFQAAATKARDYFQYLHQKDSGNSSDLYIRADYNLVKVVLKEIAFIEGLADYLKIHLDNGKTILTRMTMKGILSRLPENEFVRVHRSFIIPKSKIISVRNKQVHLPKDQVIPLGISYEEEFLKGLK